MFLSSSDPSMFCQFPGCSKPVFPGSAYCSRTHRDAGNSTEVTERCQIPGCPKPVFPGSQYCSRTHRDIGNAQHGPGRMVTTPSPQPAHDQLLVGSYPGSSTAMYHAYKPSKSVQPIYFYSRGQKYFEFTNFSDHPIQYDMKLYPTSEHLFQSLKFMDEGDSELIRRQPNSRAAFNEARRMSDRVRKDWVSGNVNIMMMEKTLLLKFTQHSRLKRKLLRTGDAPLVEDSPIDPFWGNGQDKKGRNELGKALMKIRGVLRALE